MAAKTKKKTAKKTKPRKALKSGKPRPGIFSPGKTAAVVRYQVQDVDRAVDFYTRHFGFKLTQKSGPIAVVSRGELHLLFGGPGSSGARPMPDGSRQEPGGWNRIVLYVDSIDKSIAALTKAGASFRNEVEVGPGGKQILVEDADGNPIELHEAPGK
jgi:glyoxylase I family protein